MCEYDIHPDEIIGTSIGAIIGAFIAFGLSADDIDAMIASIPKTILMTPDLRTGLLSQKGILSYFSEFLGEFLGGTPREPVLSSASCSAQAAAAEASLPQ